MEHSTPRIQLSVRPSVSPQFFTYIVDSHNEDWYYHSPWQLIQNVFEANILPRTTHCYVGKIPMLLKNDI